MCKTAICILKLLEQIITCHLVLNSPNEFSAEALLVWPCLSDWITTRGVENLTSWSCVRSVSQRSFFAFCQSWLWIYQYRSCLLSWRICRSSRKLGTWSTWRRGRISWLPLRVLRFWHLWELELSVWWGSISWVDTWLLGMNHFRQPWRSCHWRNQRLLRVYRNPHQNWYSILYLLQRSLLHPKRDQMSTNCTTYHFKNFILNNNPS